MQLYHGSYNHDEFEKKVFFSTSMDFSKDYGEVHLYEVELGNVFDTLNEEHIRKLLELKRFLYEPYDEVELHSYEEYIETPFYACDNWEMFEQYLEEIKRMGFNSVKIFEGGIENYIMFEHNFKQIA